MRGPGRCLERATSRHQRATSRHQKAECVRRYFKFSPAAIVGLTSLLAPDDGRR
ncbi:hypothetical protein OHU45_32925 [Streptomyces tubercidicus]|uniref:hypothetical protein n=1 Tax=Streptomyces tubercidicus TaxID=47759 RepID=UPI0037573159